MITTMAVSSPSSSSSPSSPRTRSENSTLYKYQRSSSSRSSSSVTRPSSPTRVRMYGRSLSPSSRSVRFPTSPRRSISAVRNQSNGGSGIGNVNGAVSNKKRTCMCSPTTHPGSFRCSLHKNLPRRTEDQTASYNSTRLNCRRSAMTNSLVRICGVEGDLLKRALSALIRPSSHHQRRRADFQPRPSRLSVMSKAEDS